MSEWQWVVRFLRQYVRQSIRRLELSPYLPHRDRISGFVYAVESGELHEVR